MLSIRQNIRHLLQNFTTAVHLDDKAKFREKFIKLHHRDRAHYLFSLDPASRKQYYSFLSARELARLLESIKPKERVPYLAEMTTQTVADILGEMYVDNAVDTMSLLPPVQLTKYMALIKPVTAHKIGSLLHYGENTAGSIMTSELIAVHEDATAGEALDILKNKAHKVATVAYIYITTKDGLLTNVVSLKHVILAEKDAPILELGRDDVLSVQATDEKIAAARMLRDYNFVALPVIDFEGHLVGVITVDDVVDLIDQLAAAHYGHLAGIGNAELTDGPVVSAFKRLPWLVMLLFLGMFTATLIGQFEGTLARIAILGAFIPVVAGTTGNSGTQSLAIMIRGLATGKLKRLSLKKYFAKEVVTAFVTSTICGAILISIILVWKQEIFIALVAGGALAASIFIGTLTGSFVPLIVSKFGADPAVASGPLITTICDVISMSIYFSLATVLIDLLL
jgi:magnesium transporter